MALIHFYGMKKLNGLAKNVAILFAYIEFFVWFAKLDTWSEYFLNIIIKLQGIFLFCNAGTDC